MILMGEYERPFSPPQKVMDRAQRLLSDLRHAEILPNISHGMNGDDPALFEQKIRQFFGGGRTGNRLRQISRRDTVN